MIEEAIKYIDELHEALAERLHMHLGKPGFRAERWWGVGDRQREKG